MITGTPHHFTHDRHDEREFYGWEPNQRVHLARQGEFLTVARGQSNSTPGIIRRVAVKQNQRYIFRVRGGANCKAFTFVGDQNKKRISAQSEPFPQPEIDDTSMTFNSGANDFVWLGVFFSSLPPEKIDAADISQLCITIEHASLAEIPLASGVCASMATIPAREGILESAVASIYGQIDHLFVHLNGFEKIPLFLKDEKISVTRSQSYGDLKDTGKFLGTRNVDDNTIYLTLDDDILYPSDYSRKIWLGNLGEGDTNETLSLYAQSRKDHSLQTSVMSGASPWGFEKIRTTAEHAFGPEALRLFDKSVQDFLRFGEWLENGCAEDLPDMIPDAKLAHMSQIAQFPQLIAKAHLSQIDAAIRLAQDHA